MTASSSSQDASNPLEALSQAARGAAGAVAAALARLPLALPRRQQNENQNQLQPQPRPSAATAAASTTAPSFPGARSAAAAAAAASASGTRVTKEELGRATWTLLHSVAASYPQNPTRSQRRAFSALVHSLAELYPCADCAEHFAKIVDARPPERAAASGGEAAQQWCCEAHNDVNERVGKPRFDCSLAGARWSSLDCEVDGMSSCELAAPGGARSSSRRKT